MMHQVIRPRRLIRWWWRFRDGFGPDGRYRRYLIVLVPGIAAIWLTAICYILLASPSYRSTTTLILPGSGSGGSMNVDSIGQASAATASAFSSPTLSPTESYKRLLSAEITLDRAAKIAGVETRDFPSPAIKLVDQTNLIEIAIDGANPAEARRNGEALRKAFLFGLDQLRADESEKRERADRQRIATLQEKVRVAQRRLLDQQGRTGLVSLDQFSARVGALDVLQDRARTAKVDAARGDAAVGRLAAALRISVGDARRAMLLKADPLFQKLLDRYAQVSTDDVQTGATLGRAHEDRAKLDAEATTLREALADRGRGLTGLQGSTLLRFADLSVSEGRARMFEALVTGDSQAAGAGAALGELNQQIADQTAATDQLVEDAATLTDRIRDLRVAEAVFSSALARLDTNKADPFASYPLVQTLEMPSLPDRPASPSKNLAIAGALGATLMFLTGSMLAWLRQPILKKLLPNA